ncbi:MAG: hypothetical protein AAFV53_20115 [Myxococcota bacterium]
MKKTSLIILSVVLLAGIGGGVTYALWPDPEPDPEPDPQAEEDTGMSRFQTEELMRTIGYVQ